MRTDSYQQQRERVVNGQTNNANENRDNVSAETGNRTESSVDYESNDRDRVEMLFDAHHHGIPSKGEPQRPGRGAGMRPGMHCCHCNARV